MVGEQSPRNAASLLGPGQTGGPKVSRYQCSDEAPVSLGEETVATE